MKQMKISLAEILFLNNPYIPYVRVKDGPPKVQLTGALLGAT